jgi:hypothetical protein
MTYKVVNSKIRGIRTIKVYKDNDGYCLYTFHQTIRGPYAGEISLNWAYARNSVDELEEAIKFVREVCKAYG